MKRDVAFLLLRITLIPFLLRELVQRKKTTIILYHDPKPELAAEHFSVLRSRYNLISLKRFLEAKQRGTLDQLPAKSLVITFDDGHKGNYELLPIVRQNGIPITIFLCTRIVGTHRHFWFLHPQAGAHVEDLKLLTDQRRLEILNELGFDETQELNEREALSRAEIDEMKEIVDFQAHTLLHPVLPRCSDERARREIHESYADLQEMGLSVFAISYPNGDYSDRDIALSRQAGYRCGITVDPGYNTAKTDDFRLKRINIPDDASIHSLLVRASGLWDLVRDLIKVRPYGYAAVGGQHEGDE